MASSLRRLNLLARSFGPAAPQPAHNIITSNRRFAYRLLSIHASSRRQYSENMIQTRSYSSSSMPKFTFDESFLRTQMETMAGIPSMFFTMVTANMPGMEIDERLCVSLNIPGVKKEAMNAIISKDNNLFIKCRTHEQVFMGGMKLPENVDRNRHVINELEDGMLKFTLPLVKTNKIIANDAMDTFFDTTHCTTFYCAMMDRSCQEGDIGEAMADLKVKCKSFTLYKKESFESVYIKGSMPGVEKMEVTSEGLCVSLDMPGFEIDDVKCGFAEYNSLAIEGKRKNEHCIEHYIAGVRILEGFHGEDHMIKKEIENGVYKATLPRVDVIKDEDRRKTGMLELVVYRY